MMKIHPLVLGILLTTVSLAEEPVQAMYVQQMQMPVPESYEPQEDLQETLEKLREKGAPMSIPRTAAEEMAQQVVLQDVTLHRLFLFMDQQEKLRQLRERFQVLNRRMLEQRARMGLREEERDEWRRRLSRSAKR